MSLRLFAAIPVPEEIGRDYLRLQKGVPGARWRPLENFHITLRFFGEMDERQAEDLDAELAHIALPAFPVELGGADWFGKADPHALWMSVKAPDTLIRLNQGCERAARKADLAPDTRKYTPHMTIAYLNKSPVEKVHRFVQRAADVKTHPWQVTHFTLFASWTHRGEANIYEALADYPLG